MATPEQNSNKFTRLVSSFEQAVVLVLMALLMVVTGVATAELGWLLFTDMTRVDVLVLDIEEMFELFGFFLLVMIGLELLATLKSFLNKRVIHVEVVLEVALIAIAQKIIVLDTSRTGSPTLFGLAAMVFALACAFWLMRRARRRT